MKKERIYTVRADGEAYPEILRNYPDMPEALYCIGNLPGSEPCAAIVGARLCSGYGREQAYEIAKYLAARGISVISGMAVGVDSYAQEGALAGGGRTYAVLGCGPDICYPRSAASLYERIIGQGGILSEFPPGTQPLRRNFPLRNRIISALSDAVIVIEARARSGSLITADHALEQGKTVFALPGRVGDDLSEGCHYLIAQGAGIIWSYEELFLEIEQLSSNRGKAAAPMKRKRLRKTAGEGIAKEQSRKEAEILRELDPAEAAVWRCLSADPLSAQSISGECGLRPEAVCAVLVSLLMKQMIEEPVKGQFVRIL